MTELTAEFKSVSQVFAGDFTNGSMISHDGAYGADLSVGVSLNTGLNISNGIKI